MAYQALYRAYRPQDFKSVAGQKHVVVTLQNAIKLNKVAHAYLFSGPRGTGKTTMAKIMAKALNCVHGPTTEPCNECEICKGISKGIISDIVEIDAASNNGVDEIRELRDKVKFLPSECKYKVYIIDEVHMLSQGAFNALLKTLEEPPAHVIFILATTEPHKIPATILSRCQRFDFQSLDKEDIVQRLKYVIEQEKINVSLEAIDLISEFCEGGMRDALSLLDQSISYSTDDIVDANDVLAVSGNTSSADILKLLSQAYEGNGAKVLEYLNDIIGKGKEIPRIINDLIIFLRDTLLFKIGKNDSLKSAYQTNEYKDFANKLPNNITFSWLDILNETLNNIKFTTQKRAFLELGLLKMTEAKENDISKLIKRIERLERQVQEGTFKAIPKETSEQMEINFSDSAQAITPYEKLVGASPSIPEDEILDDSYISSKDIGLILNNGDKALKKELEAILLDPEQNKNASQYLKNAKIAACGLNKAILVLEDIASSNRLMREQYYQNAMSVFNYDKKRIEEIYCIPSDKWNIILNDFSSKHKQNIKDENGNIILNPLSILVKKHVNVEIKDDLEDKIIEMFDKNIIKVEE